MRLGNVRNASGELVSLNSVSAMLPPDGSPRYDPRTRSPVWHTDSTFRTIPPIGSALFCKQAPPSGGSTCFANMHAAYASLSASQREELQGLECVCSLAHHDAKVHSYSP